MNHISTADRNIVLTGFMGTGKSTVGRIIAEQLGWRFVDADDEIEERFGPIERIFALEGEGGFRSKERQVALDLAESERTVIATGGGMLLDSELAQRFSASGVIFCLRAEPDAILERVLADVQVTRPLLDGDDPAARIRELLRDRERAYAAFTQVSTDEKSPTQVADEIIGSLLYGR